MKVLVSAYACEPGKGSEPGAGWRWAGAAAQEHEVWLLTRSNNRSAIDDAIAEDPRLAQRIHPVYLDLPPWIRRWKRGPRGVHLYYALWQQSARRTARRLHGEHRFDVAHHVTFAIDWMPAGVVGIRDLPAVWGPVGGASPLPWSLRRWFGARGLAAEVARSLIGATGRLLIGGRTARRSALVVAQNHFVARRFRRASPIVEPNVAIDDEPVPIDTAGATDPAGSAPHPTTRRTVVFVGRLVRWKGARLAVAAIAHPAAAGWQLRLIGSGPDDKVLESDAARLGIADRVTFEGQVSRADVGSLLAAADAFMFPSMHDAAGWAVAEAVIAGLPVVCLDVCGPPVILERTGGGVAVPVDRHVVEHLAQALGAATPPTTVAPVSADRLAPMLTQWYERATGAVAAPRGQTQR